MLRNDPLIPRAAARRARLFQAVFPLTRRLLYSSPRLQFATKSIAKPARLTIPTRHGDLTALVYAPTAADVAEQAVSGRRPPVHLLVHGGAFIIRVPEQEDNVARYLASEVGCFVVVPNYDTAPTVRFPVAEEQCYDAFGWVHEHGAEHGWDGERVSVGGASAGGKLALNVALMAIDHNAYRPVAVASDYGVADLTLDDKTRTSPKRRPIVAPNLMQLVRETYFVATDLSSPLASPALHPRLAELPPTLIQTADLDTLKHESNALAGDLMAKGVAVTHREFAGVDHGFTHNRPVPIAREAIENLGRHLTAAYGAPWNDPERVVRGFVDDVVNGGRLDLLERYWAPDMSWNGGSLGTIHGLGAFREHLVQNVSGAFTGMHLDIKETVVAGHKVVLRFTNSGTQSGEFLGSPASGKHAEWLGIGIYTVVAGKITKAWFGEDTLGMFRQLGIKTLPPMIPGATWPL